MMNPLIEKLLPWYHGDRSQALVLEIPSSELSYHALDEIIDEIHNNPVNFKWEGPAGPSAWTCFLSVLCKQRRVSTTC